MKKLLLALLAVTGFSVAQAQSSVTIYGILDVGYIGTNYKGVGTSATNKQTTNAFGNSAESTSRLGFKGTEDLGGGTSAIFTLETGLNPDQATLSTFNTRQAFVGLKQQGLGTVAIGTQYTPIYNAVAVTDAGQSNNMLGSLIFASSPQANGNSGSAPFANSSSSAGTSDAFTLRTSNALTVSSDTFAGFQGQALIVSNGTNNTETNTVTNGTTTITGGKNTNSGWGLGANYTYGKLYATVAYQAFKNYTSGTLETPTPALWTTAAGGVNTQDNQTYAAATYDFGILKAYAQYINRKATDSLNTGYFAKRQAEQIGVRGFFTPRIEGWASAGLGKTTAFGQGSPAANFTGYQLGTNYWLSKRTNAYAIFGSTQTSSVSPSTAAISGNGYAVGVRHTF
jgi:predicted porin